MANAALSLRRSRGTILVVDDDEDIRDALEHVLDDAGYSIVTAADGKQALDLLFSTTALPDLIILDLKMPGKNGYEVLEALRHSVTLVNVPVVVLSAHLGILPQGAVAWLKKPVAPVVLFGVIDRNLRAV